MENWTSMALSNFPRLWDVKSIRPFHGVKMTELSIILLWLQGKPQMLWKCCFIKTYLAPFLSLSGIHKNICTLLQNYFWQMNNVANWRLKGQTDWEGAKITLVHAFVHVLEHTGLLGINDNETLFYKQNDFHHVPWRWPTRWIHFEMYLPQCQLVVSFKS